MKHLDPSHSANQACMFIASYESHHTDILRKFEGQSSDDMVDQIFSTHFAPKKPLSYVCLCPDSSPTELIDRAKPQDQDTSANWSEIFKKPSPDSYFAPPARRLRGVHNRHSRAQGNTPAEASKFNEVIAGIADDLDRTAMASLRGGTRFAQSADPFASSGSLGSLFRARDVRTRTTRWDEAELTEDLSSELDQMKEELSALSTDVDVLEWAKVNVFKLVQGEDGESQHSPVYSYILAHTMSIIRETYNNPYLALALFQHAQTLSLESYLSGCLTGAYNELLAIRWDCFQDVAGVEQAIREMDANGVKWDKRTKGIVNRCCTSIWEGVRDHKRMEPWGNNPQLRIAALERRTQADMDREELIFNQKKKMLAEKRRADREISSFQGSTTSNISEFEDVLNDMSRTGFGRRV